VVKNTPAKAGDTSLFSGSKEGSGGGRDNPLQYSCLENSVDKGAWGGAKVHRVSRVKEITNDDK